MSNPGVIELASKVIMGQSFRIEDNIGEAIHIHWGNIRVDLSITEFYELSNQIVSIWNSMININGFDVSKFNPVFFNEQAECLLKLQDIKYDEIYLEDLKTEFIDTDGHKRLHSITESRISKALNGDNKDMIDRQQCNWYGQTNAERLDEIYNSIKTNGYPYNDEYIVVYNNGNYVHDGCHRASCLYYLYGNIKVPIIRLYFNNNCFSDEWIEEVYDDLYKQTIENAIEKSRHINLAKNTISRICKEKLSKRKVAIKGAGEHTEELLKVIGNDIDIVCIVANDKVRDLSYNIKIITNDELEKYDIDVIIVSSYKYREEMKEEIEELPRQYEVMDIYDCLDNIGMHIYQEFYR